MMVNECALLESATGREKTEALTQLAYTDDLEGFIHFQIEYQEGGGRMIVNKCT